MDMNRKKLIDKLQELVRQIVEALIEFKKNKKASEAFKHFELKEKQKIRIEDLLQIFVDDIAQMKDFLSYVIDKFGVTCEQQLKELTGPSMNLYHRLLECYLYLNQNSQSAGAASMIPNYTMLPGSQQKKIVEDINSFIDRYDSKVDKHYVLFLFQIYNYSEGVQGVCERLSLKQELLSYYIQKKDASKVLEICTRYTSQKKQGTSADDLADLWIQALTFFRDMDQASGDSEEYLQKALETIGAYKILSPLLVLEIVQGKKNLKFKVLRKYLLDRLKQ